jgi:hypothetical protein
MAGLCKLIGRHHRSPYRQHFIVRSSKDELTITDLETSISLRVNAQSDRTVARPVVTDNHPATLQPNWFPSEEERDKP